MEGGAYEITAITASLRLTVNNRSLLVNEWKTLRIITQQRDAHFLYFMDFMVPAPALPGPVCYHGHRAQSCAWRSERGLADGILLHSFQRLPLCWVQPPSDPQNVVLSGATDTDHELTAGRKHPRSRGFLLAV